MSRSKTGGKGGGYEYWKSRLKKYKFYELPGKLVKKLTHKKERRDAKNIKDE